MKIMQFCVMVLVVGSNGMYHWTPNGYVAGLVGLFAALLATVIIVDSLRFLRWIWPNRNSSRLPLQGFDE
jgi:hypothetical protein